MDLLAFYICSCGRREVEGCLEEDLLWTREVVCSIRLASTWFASLIRRYSFRQNDK